MSMVVIVNPVSPGMSSPAALSVVPGREFFALRAWPLGTTRGSVLPMPSLRLPPPRQTNDQVDRFAHRRVPQSRRCLPTSSRASVSSYPGSKNIFTVLSQHWAIPCQRRIQSSSVRACLCPHLATPRVAGGLHCSAAYISATAAYRTTAWSPATMAEFVGSSLFGCDQRHRCTLVITVSAAAHTHVTVS